MEGRRPTAASRQAGERRTYLLRAHRAVLDSYAEFAARTGADPVASDTAVALFRTGERLRREYLTLLPDVRLSRCPHTGAVLSLPMDTTDVDGLWWAYQTPLRLSGSRPPTLVALTGAMRLGAPPPDTPFLVQPGPATPYLLPRLLADTSVVAVVSTVPVGPHTGYAIAYYSTTPETSSVRANDWGANGFTRPLPDGTLEWGAVPDGLDARDHDLRPWLDAGRVRWIDPGDGELVLRTGTDGCPYLDLPGTREPQRLAEGRLR